MNTELKNAWCDALESNKYEQGTRRLRTRDEFCCLGVLCDVMDKNKWVLSYGHYSYNGWSRVIDGDVRDEIGIADDIQDTLIDMNDNGKTFQEIATFIKENL